MGKIVMSGPQNVTLDGVVQDPDGAEGFSLGGWFEHDLVDEVRLVVFPVVLGAGERLFAATSNPKPMRLVRVEAIGDDLVFVTYKLVRSA